MSNRFGTLMYIPHENSEVKSIHLSRRMAVGVSTLAIGAVAMLVGFGVIALGPGHHLDGGKGLESENQALRGELSSMEGEIASLGERLESLLEREEELRLVADLPPVPLEVQAVGVGGPGHVDNVSDVEGALGERVTSASASIDELLRRSELVASSMEEITKSVAAKKAKFSATPSIWPASGFLSSTYSMRRRHPIFHDMRPHLGIDISARHGSPIVATAAGRVVKAGWENGHGKHIEIDHGYGVKTTYSHASRVLVKRGQRIDRGDTIGLVGSTGFSIAPHVHYEVHERSEPVDPLKYIFPDAIAD